jgi:hypothetical protein
MQIDRYTHLQFPRNNTPGAADGESADMSRPQGLGSQPEQASATTLGDKPLRVDSVVLKLQHSVDVAVQDDPGGVVYADTRKTVRSVEDPADADALATDHQRAIDRNAGLFTRITLDKDGVLVAKPQPAAVTKEPDFVALAVSAMREFSDEAERQKSQSVDFNAAPAEMPWGRLKGLQQLAAKFNVFA